MGRKFIDIKKHQRKIYPTPSGKWIAIIFIKGKRKHIGTFDTEELALEGYDNAILNLDDTFNHNFDSYELPRVLKEAMAFYFWNEHDNRDETISKLFKVRLSRVERFTSDIVAEHMKKVHLKHKVVS